MPCLFSILRCLKVKHDWMVCPPVGSRFWMEVCFLGSPNWQPVNFTQTPSTVPVSCWASCAGCRPSPTGPVSGWSATPLRASSVTACWARALAWPRKATPSTCSASSAQKSTAAWHPSMALAWLSSPRCLRISPLPAGWMIVPLVPLLTRSSTSAQFSLTPIQSWR